MMVLLHRGYSGACCVGLGLRWGAFEDMYSRVASLDHSSLPLMSMSLHHRISGKLHCLHSGMG